MKQEFFSAKEIALYFGLSESGVRKFHKHYADFPQAIKLGSSCRWNLNEILQWAKNNHVKRQKNI